MKAKGNGRWFYFFLRCMPDKMYENLAEYGKTSVQDIQERFTTEKELHDYAEFVGLINNRNDFDRSPINDTVALSAMTTMEWLRANSRSRT